MKTAHKEVIGLVIVTFVKALVNKLLGRKT